MAADMDKLRGMSAQELRKEEQDLRDQIWKLRMQLASGQLDNPQQVRRSRRDLARVLTIIREQQSPQASK